MGLLKITRALADRGHHVTLAIEDWEYVTAAGKLGSDLTHQNYTLLLNRAYDTPEEGQTAFLSIRDRMAELGKNPIAALKFVLGVQADLCRQFILNPDTAKELEKLKSGPNKVDFVIADFSHSCSIILADYFDVPYVIYSPTSLGEPLFTAMAGTWIPPAVFPAHGTGLPALMSFGQRLGNWAGSQFMARVLAPAMLHNPLRAELGVKQRADIGDARLFLLNADFAVEFPVALPPLFKMVGPLMATPAGPLDPAVAALLRSGTTPGAIYASFGSAFVLDKEEEVRSFAAALAKIATDHGRAVVWRIIEDELPKNVTLDSLNLPPAVHTLKWAPQNDILGSGLVAVFLSHAGTNGCYESAYHGTPMVNIPMINDHMDHAEKVKHRGYALTVDRATLAAGDPEPLVAAVAAVAENPEFKKRAQAVGAMLRGHKRSAPDRAADWVEYALTMPADGSGDLRGVSGKLSWAALSSVDVGLAWMAILGLILGVLLLVVWLAFRAVRGAARVVLKPKRD